MKLSAKIFILAACIQLPVIAANVHDEKKTGCTQNKHEIRIGYSDGITLGGSTFLGIGLSDAITGTKRTDTKTTGVFGIGYRYSACRRFKVGLDFGLSKVTSKVTGNKEKSPSIKEKELNFIILPTADFIYFQRNLYRLYGSVSAGVDFTRNYEIRLNEKGKEQDQKKSKFEKEFAYQINLIGLRIGNNRIGGFVEAGFGYKGFITAGLSLGF